MCWPIHVSIICNSSLLPHSLNELWVLICLEIKGAEYDDKRFRCEIGSIISKMTDWQVCEYASVSLMLLWLVSPQSN